MPVYHNAIVKIITVAIGAIFAFTSVTKAGDGYILQTDSAGQEQVNDAASIAGTPNETSEIHDRLGITALGTKKHGLLEAVPIPASDLAALYKADLSCQDIAGRVIAGDNDSYTWLFLIMVAVAIWILVEMAKDAKEVRDA